MSAEDDQEEQIQEQTKRSAREKARLVLEADGLADQDLGAFLRTHGIHEAELEEWRRWLDEGPAPKVTKRERQIDKKRIKKLERELRKKNKALAETAALLVLQKKVQAIWGDEDDDTDPSNGD